MTQTMIKKTMVGVGASALLFGTIAVPAFALGDVSQASPCGSAHGAFADTNGNFGFLGDVGGTPGYHDGAVGQDVGATGYNNSNTGCQG